MDHDAQLMIRVKKGDREAFVTLFQKYMRPLHHFVRRFVVNPSVAEELVQEIFFKVYRAADSYEPRGKFRTYLYRIATNHCLNEVRKADYRERFDSLDQPKYDEEGTKRGIELRDEKTPHVDLLLWAQTLSEQLQGFLEELPTNQRAALLLNRLEDMSYQEIADTMEISVGAVKSLLHRAKHTLRRRLEDWKHEQETNTL